MITFILSRVWFGAHMITLHMKQIDLFFFQKIHIIFKRNDIWTTIFLQLLWQLSLSYSRCHSTFSLYCFDFYA